MITPFSCLLYNQLPVLLISCCPLGFSQLVRGGASSGHDPPPSAPRTLPIPPTFSGPESWVDCGVRRLHQVYLSRTDRWLGEITESCTPSSKPIHQTWTRERSRRNLLNFHFLEDRKPGGRDLKKWEELTGIVH